MSKRCAALVFAIVCFAASRSAAAEVDKTFHERFDVVAGDVLELDHRDGSVDIEPWDQNVLDVTVRYRASIVRVGIGSAKEFDVELRKTGNVIHVGEKRGSHEVMIGFHSENVHEHFYQVRAPAWLKLELDGEDGDVALRNWRGTTRCTIEDGDLAVEGFDGSIEIDSEDGDVDLARCRFDEAKITTEDGRLNVSDSSGPLRIRAEDGDVTVRGHSAAAIHVRASDSDVEIGIRRGSAALDLDVQTEDGDVSVALAPDVSAEIVARGGEGQVRVDLTGIRNLKSTEREATGTLGAGTGRIRIASADGTIVLEDQPLEKVPGTR